MSDQFRRFGFARAGEDCAVAGNRAIVGLENIVFGDHVRIDGCTGLIARRGALRIGSRVHVCSGRVIGALGGVELSSASLATVHHAAHLAEQVPFIPPPGSHRAS